MTDDRHVATGLDVAVRDRVFGGDTRVGLVTTAAATTSRLERGVDALVGAGTDIVAVFGPEHGLFGSGQAGESEGGTRDERTGIPIVDTYRLGTDRLDRVVSDLHIDVLVCDLADIGTRYWTFTSTMVDLVCCAARVGVPIRVLDRPNPLGGGFVEGPILDPAFSSFIGRLALPQVHGLTIGELALVANAHVVPQRAGRAADLSVITVEGWRRGTPFDDTGMPWVPPSPNMPTVDTAFAFAATGLLEGTNISEGRGTTRPFELLGAPFLDRRFVTALEDRGLPGVTVREVVFTPTFSKSAGERVRGVALHVTDRDSYRPVFTGVTILGLLARLYPGEFRILAPHSAADGRCPLDLLWGSESLRHALDEGRDPRELVDAAHPPSGVGTATLLYELPSSGAEVSGAEMSGAEVSGADVSGRTTSDSATTMTS